MAFVYPVIAVAGVALGALGAVRQGQAAKAQAQGQANIAAYNAEVARKNALSAQQVAEVDVSDIRRQTRRQIGMIRARQAGSGVLVGEGSPLLVQVEQAGEGELEAQRRIFAGQLEGTTGMVKAQQSTAQSQAFLQQGTAAHRAGTLKAFGTAAKGISSLRTSGTFSSTTGAGTSILG